MKTNFIFRWPTKNVDFDDCIFRYPLIDGTFFISPRQHTPACIQVKRQNKNIVVAKQPPVAVPATNTAVVSPSRPGPGFS